MDQLSNEFLQCLYQVFKIDSKNVGLILENSFLEILNTYPIDEKKLLQAFLILLKLRKEGARLGFNDSNLLFNVSKDNLNIFDKDKVFVKIFYSKTEPVIYFYNQDNLFLKVKLGKVDEKSNFVIESSNNQSLLTGGKNSIVLNKPYFYSKDKFLIKNNASIEDKILKIKTNSSINSNVFDKQLLDKRQLIFINFIEKMIINKFNKQPLSKESVNLLFSNFYNIFQNILCEFEFTVDEIIMIIDCVVNDNYIRNSDEGFYVSEIIKTICDIVPDNSTFPKGYEFDSYEKEMGKLLNIKMVRSEKYANIVLYDGLGNRICEYLICATNNGFTLYRNICKELSRAYPVPSFTLNISNDGIKLASLNDTKEVHEENLPISIVININDDGSIDYESESKALNYFNHNKFIDEEKFEIKKTLL